MLQIHITPQIYENYRYVVLTTTEKYPIQKKSVDDGRCHGRSTGRIGMTPPVVESLCTKGIRATIGVCEVCLHTDKPAVSASS